MESFRFKARTVAWNEKPMANLVTKQIDRADRRELSAEIRICGVGTFRKNKPNAIVPRRFLVFSQHADDPVAKIDGKTGEHPTHLRVQGRERLQDKCVRKLLF